MRVKSVITILMIGAVCLSGCQNDRRAEGNQDKAVAEDKNNKEDENEYEMQVYRTPTEKEMEILEGCNLSSDYMKEIQEKGMSVSVQSFVDTAQIMLDYLEEKYEEEFTVRGGEIPGIISGDYMIFAAATTGEYAGERFEVYYRVDEEGEGYCEDGYFAILKNMEMQEYLQNIAKEAGIDFKIIGELYGFVGKEYTKDTTIDEIKELNRKDDGLGIQIYITGYARPDMSDEEFQRQVQVLEESLKQTELYLEYTVWRLVSNEKFDYIQSYQDVGKVFPQGTLSEEKYNMRYDTYIRPEKE